MTPEIFLQNQAIRFLKEQAVGAFFAFTLGATVVGLILHDEGVAVALYWALGAIFLHSLSLFFRYFNEEIFVTRFRRLRFGMIANFIEACVAGSCLWFISDVSPAAGVFMSTILLVESTGSALTSAGYKPLMWAFVGPLIFLQVLALGYCFYKTGVIIYTAAAIVSLGTAFLISLFAAHSRGMIFSLLSSQLATERAVRSKTRFFMASSHDLRQPVAASAAFVSSALRINTNEEVRKNLELAKSAIKLIDDQIAPMMELARIDSDDLEISLTEIDLISLLETVATLFQPRMNGDTELVIDLPEKGALCVTDHQILTRIISNLMDNSIKHTDHGKITLTLRPSRSGYLLTVSDTGVGIDSSQLDLIFDEFYQVNNPERDINKGFGLGLPIALRLCSKLGISLSLESDPGRYTVAKLDIPR